MARTLREIFIENGLDPLMAFVLNVADMPAEARELLRADTTAGKTPANLPDGRDLSWSAAITHGTDRTE